MFLCSDKVWLNTSHWWRGMLKGTLAWPPYSNWICFAECPVWCRACFCQALIHVLEVIVSNRLHKKFLFKPFYVILLCWLCYELLAGVCCYFCADYWICHGTLCVSICSSFSHEKAEETCVFSALVTKSDKTRAVFHCTVKNNNWVKRVTTEPLNLFFYSSRPLVLVLSKWYIRLYLMDY